MNVQTLKLASVDVGSRLRALDPAWVAVLAGEIAAGGQTTPIRVVARGDGFVLIDGAIRVAALRKLGETTVIATVEPEAALADAASLRLAEIKGNFLRAHLTMLERSYYVAAWRGVYESVNGAVVRGRRPKAGNSFQRNTIPEGGANDDDGAAAAVTHAFVLSFSEAAQKALQISQPTMSRYLRIASIAPEVGHRLVGHPSADSRVELMILAEQGAARQAAIVDLILGADAAIDTVAEAVARLDGAAAPAPLSPPERFHQTFARLRPQDRDAVYDLNADDIERWSAARAARGGKRLRSVA